MGNILNRYKKEGVITTGSDNVELDTPEFEIINVKIDTINQILRVEILHEVMQGSIKQKQSRTFNVDFSDLPGAVKVTGKEFLDAIETKILELPQYSGAIKI